MDTDLPLIDDDTFEDWVFDALDEIPEPFRAALGSLAVLIEEEPTPEQLHRLGVPGMYGLFEGVHRGSLGAEWALQPSRITIFRGPCLRSALTVDGVRERVRATVRHEVAHQLGISDARLHELELEHDHEAR
jgi:predicted Zn-dependent protease with MMP-like domain